MSKQNNSNGSAIESGESSPEAATPFFSIILPTKNRAPLIGTVIQSILNQDFADYEIIVADNDDADNHDTENAVSLFHDSRIRYFRTGNLSMAENWEYGFKQAKGQYITLIRDKALYLPQVLSKLHTALLNHPCDSLSWNEERQFSKDLETRSIMLNPDDFIITRHSSAKLIEMLLGMKYKDFQFLRYTLPKTSNSCISHKLYTTIAEKTGRLAVENAPDYTISYQILFNTDEIITINLPVNCRFNAEVKYSTGAQHDLGYINDAAKNMNSKQNSILSIDTQPLKLTNTETIVIDDFFRVAKCNNLNYSFADVNQQNYFKTTYKNTLIRQATPESNKSYFREIKIYIKDMMKKTYSSGLYFDLIYLTYLDVIFYPYWYVGSRIYHKLKDSLPLPLVKAIKCMGGSRSD